MFTTEEGRAENDHFFLYNFLFSLELTIPLIFLPFEQFCFKVSLPDLSAKTRNHLSDYGQTHIYQLHFFSLGHPSGAFCVRVLQRNKTNRKRSWCVCFSTPTTLACFKELTYTIVGAVGAKSRQPAGSSVLNLKSTP